MGKSASGKDTIYRHLRDIFPELRTVVMYTTRPIRQGECDGREYHFVTRDECSRMEAQGIVIERRTYQTIAGPWDYFTAMDGQIDLKNADYIMLGTLESYAHMQEYFGIDIMYPVYIEVEDGVRLLRAVEREQREGHPNYREVCRRFIADGDDFSEEKLQAAGIIRRYLNEDLQMCLEQICQDMSVLLINPA